MREPEHVTVVIDGRQFTLDLALDDDARVQGLQGVETIPDQGGLLFVFPESQRRSFWMINCPADIDVIFLDPAGRVTAAHRMKSEAPRREGESETAYEARLKHYSSVYPAQFAIELRGGWLKELDVDVDSKLELDVDGLKALAR